MREATPLDAARGVVEGGDADRAPAFAHHLDPNA